MGVELADHAASLGWTVTLLLGPSHLKPTDARVRVERFEQAEDLRERLGSELPSNDILVMAAAVADYRPAHPAKDKLRRAESGTLALELVPTPDLLAEAAHSARPDQLLVGFALEPANTMLESARSKLARKQLDAIIANPLETIDASDICPVLLTTDRMISPDAPQRGAMTKAAFAAWLLPVLSDMLRAKLTRHRETKP